MIAGRKLFQVSMVTILTIAMQVATFQSLTATTNAAPAGASSTVTVSQVILPPDCYDTVATQTATTDYIAVWDCTIQRPQ